MGVGRAPCSSPSWSCPAFATRISRCMRHVLFCATAVWILHIGVGQQFVRCGCTTRVRAEALQRAASPANLWAAFSPDQRMGALARSMEAQASELVRQLNKCEVAVIDNFVGRTACAAMQQEATELLRSGAFRSTPTSRWNPQSRAHERYDKDGVESFGFTADSYDHSPMCVEYIIQATSTLGPVLSQNGRRGPVLEGEQTNKLMVCKDGGAYPWHLDDRGGENNRLVTLIYYLNVGYDASCGGRFIPQSLSEKYRDYDSELMPAGGPIEPKGDRLVAFYSDELLHAVEPWSAPNVDDDVRFSLTIWMEGE